MRTEEFDYHLPEHAIAQRPAERGRSRLLVLDAEGEARHRHVSDLVDALRPGDLLVVNDTRVIPARLFARRPGGGSTELLLLEKLGPRGWLALARPAKRLRPGTALRLVPEAGDDAPPARAGETAAALGTSPAPAVQATVKAKLADGRVELDFDRELEPHLEELGHVPLPPYIRRPDDPDDRSSYQTVYARHDGSAAAP
ncbi:MAG: S-adenosylmethionine:tRNA ribosyltransferase-isomerase, partial [Holophagales bacterium]|nr:S-adenosylmethionine:tRNA ribosyltransferase-isomerase [Holophagales bacterium]